MRPRVRRAFVAAVEMVKSRVKLKDLEEAVKSQDVNKVLRVLQVRGDFAGVPLADFADDIQTIFHESAKATLKVMPKHIGTALSFDLMNPRSVRFLQRYRFELISPVAINQTGQNVGITAQTIEGIREVITDAFRNGAHPYAQARKIRNVIGLTARQARAYNAYEASLRADAKRPLDQVDRMLDRRYTRLLTQRAENIARTETIRAANEGQREVWRQAADAGLLDQNKARREWIITPDDRLCEICEAIPDLNPEGRRLDEPFETDLGPVWGPPAHPSCRCATALTEESLLAQLEKYDPNQPRDEDGKWTDGGGGGSSSETGEGERLERSTRALHEYLRAGDEVKMKVESALGIVNRAMPSEEVTTALFNLKSTPLLDRDEATATYFKFRAFGDRLESYNRIPKGLTPEETEFYKISAGMVAQWANSSGDSEAASISMQLLASELLGVDAATSHFPQEELVAAREILQDRDMKTVMSAVLKAQYENTQSWLASQGVEEVFVVRGMRLRQDESPGLTGRSQLTSTNVETEIDLQPLSSFSVDMPTAAGFGDHIVVGVIPAKNVFSLPGKGFGCQSEYEVVLVGAPDNELYMVKVGAADYNDVIGSTEEIVSDPKSVVQRFRNAVRKGFDKVLKKRINIDSLLENADWPKRTRDVWVIGVPPVEKYDPNQPRDEHGRWTPREKL